MSHLSTGSPNRAGHWIDSTMSKKTAPDPHVIIVGGGFAGLYAARGLERKPVRITLVDRRNHHLFQPLLYQVATAALSSTDIASPLRKILRRQSNVTVLLSEVRNIDTTGKRVATEAGELGYDYLFLATGVTHNYFGHGDWARFAPGLKSLNDALQIRRRVLFAYERALEENCAGKGCFDQFRLCRRDRPKENFLVRRPTRGLLSTSITRSTTNPGGLSLERTGQRRLNILGV